MKLLVTGASGSLGTALLVDTFARGAAEKVVAFARGEHRLAELAERLGHPPGLQLMVGDVRDADRVEDALGRIDTVIHAAALKRLDVVNHDPREIMETNYQGALNVIRAAVRRNVPRVLFISTDKACCPVTPYGVSKLAAEFYAIAANGRGWPQTRIACVRYGNVLGSQGSVLPLWRQQLARGEPLTITDERMTRFWITMPQALNVIRRALGTMRGGEVFIPVLSAGRVLDLAEALGGKEVPVKIIGTRAGGEKLHETLLSEDESPRAACDGERFILEPAHTSWSYQRWHGPRAVGGAYRSDQAPRMSVEALRTMIATHEDATS